MTRRILKVLILAIAVVLISLGLFTRTEHKVNITPRDYQEIKASGVIKAVTEYNSISYRVADDTIIGFDYELINAFARHMGLKAEVTPEMSFDKRLSGITEGKYDLMATPTLVTSTLKDTILFSRTMQLGNLILVQRKQMPDADSSTYVGELFDLKDKTIHVVKNSPTYLRLNNLMNEIAYEIKIKEIDKYTPEQLVALVAAGDIDYTVCSEHMAGKLLEQYDNIDISTKLSFTQFHAWGVNKNAPALLDSLNLWLDEYIKTKDYKALYKKYFN